MKGLRQELKYPSQKKMANSVSGILQLPHNESADKGCVRMGRGVTLLQTTLNKVQFETFSIATRGPCAPLRYNKSGGLVIG